jgi:hypothetical protein
MAHRGTESRFVAVDLNMFKEARLYSDFLKCSTHAPTNRASVCKKKKTIPQDCLFQNRYKNLLNNQLLRKNSPVKKIRDLDKVNAFRMLRRESE